MARRKPARRIATRKQSSARAPSGRASRVPKTPIAGHFVGRAGSPVLAKYPPKAMDAAVGEAPLPPPPSLKVPPAGRAPAAAAARPTVPSPLPTPVSAASPDPPQLLISLERPFDVDDFSQLLGQTQIQVTVPRDSVAEVLRRACDFMGFGIYVYTIRVRPGPEELLKTFIVELQRVDFSPQAKDWTPFQERGRADSPFGPTGSR